MTIKAQKIQMTQIFKDDGRVVPVTYLRSDDDLSSLTEGMPVAITGTSKGKGFAGVMKKWNFKGGDRTRGQSNKPRSAGSIGAQTPDRVLKNKKMAGRMGNVKVTVKGMTIALIDSKNKQFAVTGPVPGFRNSKVLVKSVEK